MMAKLPSRASRCSTGSIGRSRWRRSPKQRAIRREHADPDAGDVIAEIETDKATMEVEAVDEGTIGKILVPEGSEQVPVNKPIALLLEEGETAPSSAGEVAARAEAGEEGGKAAESLSPPSQSRSQAVAGEQAAAEK